MSGVATAIIGAAVIGGGVAIYSANKSADAAESASQTSADSQTETLNYLKKINAVPQQFKEESLQTLGGLYGLEGGIGNQQDLIDRAKASPLYTNIMGSKETGEDAILRNASATGGLRSGDTSYNLYDYNVRLQNQALLESYNQQLMGIQGLANLPTNENKIADTTSGIGNTLAQGQIASAQATQTGNQNALNNIMASTQLGISAYKAGMFSDRRLKTNIKKIGEIKGFNFYSFDWNHTGNMLGLRGSTYGCMADEVIKKVPEAVSLKNGFLFINYSTIGVL